MASSTIYTRAYSNRSAGQLASGRGPTGHPLTYRQLLSEFERHKISSNRIPTALVSVSNRIVDTLTRAISEWCNNDESPSDIWVVFIRARKPKKNSSPATIHPARQLAEACGDPEPRRFTHEFLFEWAIPEDYVLRKVSLQTLMDRGEGSDIMSSLLDFQPPSTQELIRHVAEPLECLTRDHGPWEVAEVLADFATTLGARAPGRWIAHRLFQDCVFSRLDRPFDDVIHLEFSRYHLGSSSDRSTAVDFDWCWDLGEGVNIFLKEQFERLIFSPAFDDFTVWEKGVKDDIKRDVGMFANRWCDEGEQFPNSCNEAWDELSAEHRGRREDIEREAVTLGL